VLDETFESSTDFFKATQINRDESDFQNFSQAPPKTFQINKVCSHAINFIKI